MLVAARGRPAHRGEDLTVLGSVVSRGFLSDLQCAELQLARHHGDGNFSELAVVAARVTPKLSKRFGHIDVGPLRQDTLRLFDGDPAVERALKLSVHGLCFCCRLILQDDNGGTSASAPSYPSRLAGDPYLMRLLLPCPQIRTLTPLTTECFTRQSA